MRCISGINNVFNDQHLAAFNIYAEINIVAYFEAAGYAAVVGSQLCKSNFAGDIYLFYQIGNKQKTAV